MYRNLSNFDGASFCSSGSFSTLLQERDDDGPSVAAGKHADAEHTAEPLSRALGHGHLLSCSQTLQLLLAGAVLSIVSSLSADIAEACCLMI